MSNILNAIHSVNNDRDLAPSLNLVMTRPQRHGGTCTHKIASMLGAHKKRAIKARVVQSNIEAPGEDPVARGLAPVGLRSSPKTSCLDLSESFRRMRRDSY
jgi:hypothetical protein